MKKIIALIVTFLILQMQCFASFASPEREFVLVCHKDCPVDELTSQDVKRIFLGKMKKFPDGSSISVVMNTEKMVHDRFSRTVLQKSPMQLSNYWKKNLFSGKSILPVFIKTDAEAMRFLSSHANTLSYISRENLDSSLKQIIIVE